jgi:hypothetical protein
MMPNSQIDRGQGFGKIYYLYLQGRSGSRAISLDNENTNLQTNTGS